MLSRLTLASSLLGAVFATLAPAAPAAQAEKPVRFVVPYVAAGTNDVIARIVADKLAARRGQPFVVDNRAGANMVVGCEIVARASPDGSTLLIVGAGFAVNPSLRTKLPFDTERDFAPVGLVAGGPYLMVVNASVPAKTVSEFTAWVKARPGQVNYASTGVGSPPHLAAELLKMAASIDMQHVPYKGGGAVLPDLLANRVQMFFGSISTLRPQVQTGKLRAIGVTTLTRAPAMPDIPTFIESGLAGFEVNAWYGMLAPGKTPRTIVSRLNADLRAVLDDADTRQRFALQGLEVTPSTADEFAVLIRSEIPKWAKVAKAAGIQPE